MQELYARVLLVLIAWGWAFAAAAQAACPPAPQPLSPQLFQQAAAQARDRGLLWSVSKDGRNSWLYGTLHLGRAEWMAPGPGVRQALQAADLVALEIDLLDEGVQRAFAASQAAQQGRSLSPRTAQRLQAAWKAACLPAADLARGAPELHVLGLMAGAGEAEGFSPVYGSEILLSLLAKGLGKPVVSLETVPQQLQALLARDAAEAEGFVTDSLDDLEKGRLVGVLRKTADVWERGDIGQLEAYTSWCECADTAAERALMRRVLDDRNPGLAAGIDALHAQGKSVFAAVGAMHMVGQGGLVESLRKKGYEIRRMH
ncbi:TraB/GumN family protein [uncultured Ramlibacter sp.]|uniref:TraB/GumN family protein n=1 Tax=uncultured Ramlibacter sp. TaxID=260755 RepID=UPI0026320C87|nr:TraB/GumN family protein [uncultured Ramlibacter sp.]